MEIKYYIKNVYGRDLRYIKDKRITDALEQLTGKKTLDDKGIKALEQLGHTFKQALP